MVAVTPGRNDIAVWGVVVVTSLSEPTGAYIVVVVGSAPPGAAVDSPVAAATESAPMIATAAHPTAADAACRLNCGFIPSGLPIAERTKRSAGPHSAGSPITAGDPGGKSGSARNRLRREGVAAAGRGAGTGVRRGLTGSGAGGRRGARGRNDGRTRARRLDLGLGRR